MPELPEVETVRRGLLDLIIGKTIKDVSAPYSKIIRNMEFPDFRSALLGQTFLDIKRKGKILIFLLNKAILLSHLRMEGKYVLRHEEAIAKHEHVIFWFTDGSNLRYADTRKFGVMDLFLTTDIFQVMACEPLCKVGLEPMDPEMNVAYLKNKFGRSQKPIKTTLLDQTVMAGLGNIYVDEVLFLSKIHPNSKTNALSDQQIANIIGNSRAVLQKAIELGGTTIRSFVSSHEVSGRFQNVLLVHTKEICPVCQGKITKIRVGGRGTYVCENCQKNLT